MDKRTTRRMDKYLTSGLERASKRSVKTMFSQLPKEDQARVRNAATTAGRAVSKKR